ncbi:MAG: methylated-DNA--[protein]-cysteine S-methyltransferase [Actinomycetota bacterium]
MTDRFIATSVPTPLGELTAVVSTVGVVATFFDDDEDAALELERLETRLDSPIARSGRGLLPVRREIEAYFRGSKRAFATPVDLCLAGVGFPRRVLEATMRIPYGVLATYGDMAAAAGSLRGGRAAGNALNRCPVELFVPCHRVVHAGGTIGGYGRYENRKRWLLRHESAI